MCLYNYKIYLDALNKYTNFKFIYADEIYQTTCQHIGFDVIETSDGRFSLIELTYDNDTGLYNDREKLSDETLADIIDKINHLERGV